MREHRVEEAILDEVGQLLDASWRLGDDDHPSDKPWGRHALEVIARAYIKAGDYGPPEEIQRRWRARWHAYKQQGGRARFIPLDIDLAEDPDPRFAADLIPIDYDDDWFWDEGGLGDLIIQRRCPVCYAAPDRHCRDAFGGPAHGFHAPRGEDVTPVARSLDPVYSRACSWCKAPPGRKCRSTGGGFVLNRHHRRREQ